jgi:dipeptidyl aminopeptidase/acylaminoacyl peptidase
VFYVVDRPPFEIHRIAAGFPDTGRPIWDEPNALDTLDPNVSPDGRTIAFIRSQLETGSDLLSRPLDGSEPVRTIRANREDERSASFSPDSRWVVYQTNETGRWEVYVEPFPGPGERVQISADGGQEPLWAGNGEIFFRRLDEIRVVATSLESGFAAEPPRALFEHPILHGVDEDTRTWDVTADGQRILAVSTPEASRPRKIEIVTDFLSELERRVPTSGTR